MGCNYYFNVLGSPHFRQETVLRSPNSVAHTLAILTYVTYLYVKIYLRLFRSDCSQETSWAFEALKVTSTNLTGPESIYISKPDVNLRTWQELKPEKALPMKLQ